MSNYSTIAGAPRTKTAPGISQRFPWGGAAARYTRDPLQFWIEGHRGFGDVFRYEIGPMVFHLLAHPDHVKHVLQDRVANYPRGKLFELFKVGAGEGLITTEGSFWWEQRRVCDPAFAAGRIESLEGQLTRFTARMLENWKSAAHTETPLELMSEMMRLQLRFLSAILFGDDLSDPADPRNRHLAVIREYMNWKINAILSPPPWVPTPYNLRLKRSLRSFDRAIHEIIAARRRQPDGADDVLGILLRARYGSSGQALDDRLLRDHLVTFFLAGHELAAAAFSWTCYLLASNPAAADTLLGELTAVLGGRTACVQDLPRLPYLQRVIQESLRLYPVVWQFVRDAADDDEIGGFHIPRGSTVFLSPFVTHHHSGVWEEAERFDPDRFLPARSVDRQAFAYFPFAGGPHLCIARDLFLMEASLVLAQIMQHYRLHLVPGAPVVPEAVVALRPRHGIRVIVRST